MKLSERIAIVLISYGIGLLFGYFTFDKPCDCPETLPTTVTDMFTVKGDTIYLKQDADFVISTRGVTIDTAGIIHRK